MLFGRIESQIPRQDEEYYYFKRTKKKKIRRASKAPVCPETRQRRKSESFLVRAATRAAEMLSERLNEAAEASSRASRARERCRLEERARGGGLTGLRRDSLGPLSFRLQGVHVSLACSIGTTRRRKVPRRLVQQPCWLGVCNMARPSSRRLLRRCRPTCFCSS